MKKIIILLIILAQLSACSSTQSMSKQDKNIAYRNYITEYQLAKLDKVKAFNMRGWQSLSNEYLIVSASMKKQYLLELKGYCPYLDFSQGIIIKQTSSTSLTANFDSVASLQAPRMKCYIKSIHPISKTQMQTITAIGKPRPDDEA